MNYLKIFNLKQEENLEKVICLSHRRVFDFFLVNECFKSVNFFKWIICFLYIFTKNLKWLIYIKINLSDKITKRRKRWKRNGGSSIYKHSESNTFNSMFMDMRKDNIDIQSNIFMALMLTTFSIFYLLFLTMEGTAQIGHSSSDNIRRRLRTE